MSAKQILIVEDEKPIRDMIAFGLRRAGFDVLEAEDCMTARARVVDNNPDLMLIDWMLPDTSGLELTRWVKKNEATAEVPVIMLTARAEEDDKVRGLEGGADDYIIKPFSPRELVARINAVLRRSDPGDADGRMSAGAISMNTLSRQVFLADKLTHVGPTEYRLLEFFMTHENRAFSRSQLLDHVWGTNVFLEERTVDVHIRRLRKILEKAKLAHYIQTVRSHGYRFVAAAS